MINQPKEKQTHRDGLPLNGADNISDSDGDHRADGFEQIGVLAERIMSLAQARKRTEEANAAASSVSLCSQKGEQGGVGCNSIVRLDVRVRIRGNGVSLAGHANENFRTEQKIK